MPTITPSHRGLVLGVLVLLCAAATARCDDDCEDPTYLIAGSWASAFHCSSTGAGGCFTGTDAITVIQASEGGAPAREVTFTDDMGGSFSGTLCGNVLSWSGGGTGYTEAGTWVFDSADHFVKATAYDDTANATRGCCTGEGTRQGATAPVVPAMCPTTSCEAP